MSTATAPAPTLLAQADALLLAARLLRPPGPDTNVEIPAAERETLARLAGFSVRPASVAAFRATLGSVATTDRVTWADEHSRLFEGGSPCLPNESRFVRRDKGAILADICGFYRAFGFELAPGSGEKADHVITELEFFAMLLVMLAKAEAAPGHAASVTREALGAFCRDHLDEWLPLFCDRLEQTSAIALFRELACFLRGLFDAVVETHGLPRADRVHAGLPIADDGTPYECGLAEVCARGDEDRPGTD